MEIVGCREGTFREWGHPPGYEVCLKAFPAAQVKTKGQVSSALCTVTLSDLEAQLTDEVEWDEKLSFTLKFFFKFI